MTSGRAFLTLVLSGFVVVVSLGLLWIFPMWWSLLLGPSSAIRKEMREEVTRPPLSVISVDSVQCELLLGLEFKEQTLGAVVDSPLHTPLLLLVPRDLLVRQGERYDLELIMPIEEFKRLKIVAVEDSLWERVAVRVVDTLDGNEAVLFRTSSKGFASNVTIGFYGGQAEPGKWKVHRTLPD